MPKVPRSPPRGARGPSSVRAVRISSGGNLRFEHMLLPDESWWNVTLREHPLALAWLVANCSLDRVMDGALAASGPPTLFVVQPKAGQPKRVYLWAKAHSDVIRKELTELGVPLACIGYCFAGQKPPKGGWHSIEPIDARDRPALAQTLAELAAETERRTPALAKPKRDLQSTSNSTSTTTATEAATSTADELAPVDRESFAGLLLPSIANWRAVLSKSRPEAYAWLCSNCVLSSLFKGSLDLGPTRTVHLVEARRAADGSKSLYLAANAHFPLIASKLAEFGCTAEESAACFPDKGLVLDSWVDCKAIKVSQAFQLQRHITRIRTENTQPVSGQPASTSPDRSAQEISPTSIPTPNPAPVPTPTPAPAAAKVVKAFRLRRTFWLENLIGYPRAHAWLSHNLTGPGLFTGFFSKFDSTTGKRTLSLWESDAGTGYKTLLAPSELAPAFREKLLKLGVPPRHPILRFKLWPVEEISRPNKVEFDDFGLLDTFLRAQASTKAFSNSFRDSLTELLGGTEVPPVPTIVEVRTEPTMISARQSFTERALKRVQDQVGDLSLPTPPASLEGSPAPADGTPDSIKRAKRELEREQRDIAEGNLRSNELEVARQLFESARAGKASLSAMAIDVEMWEWNASVLLEFGWSSVEIKCSGEQREVQHVILKENQRKENKKFAPGARDHFSFGTSVYLSHQATYHTLTALLAHLSAEQPLLLLFHDSRSDLKALDQLGMPVRSWHTGVAKLDLGKESAGVYVLDTQRLWSAWVGDKRQISLGKACEALAIGTKKLHNAGNDAHFTLELFERMMDRKAVPPKPHSPLTTGGTR